MPGSNEYSMGPEDTRTESTLVTKPTAKTSPFYQERDFRQTKLQEMYGDNPTKRQLRKFNRYASSTQGQADELAFVKDESKKYLDSFSAYGDAALNRIRNANRELALKAKNPAQPTPVTPTPPPPANDPIKDDGQKPFNSAFWDGRAKEGGFADSAAVKQWQQEHGSKYGIVADGKFGPKTKAAYEQFKRDYQHLVEEGIDQNKSQDQQVQQATPFDLEEFKNKNNINGSIHTVNGNKYLRYDPNGAGDFYIDAFGNTYTAGLFGTLGRKIDPNNTELGYFGQLGYDELNKLLTKHKQGGTMNKINYFQQGGAAPQQDMQKQIVALVQAAMQGDQKATQTVNQIMEAAKAGDQQAVQLAQMIQQVAQQMQGQATAAKYGAKLNYLQSLKCGGKTKAKKKEKGGKVCPECETSQNKKALITKHQYGGNFYRNWSADDIRALQNKLYGHGYYDGELDGIIGAKTIAAVKAYQKAHGLKEDGMWGVATNSQQKMIDNAIVNKGIYSKDHKSEKGSLKTHKGMEYQGKTLHDLGNKKAQEIISYYMVNPELLYSDDPKHAQNRQLLHNSGKDGADLLNQIAASLTDEERQRIDSKKLTTSYKQDQMVDKINTGRNRAAEQLIPVMAAPALLSAGPLATLVGAAGSAILGKAGENLGHLYGIAQANETGNEGYVNLYSDPKAERYGVVSATYDPKRLVEDGKRTGRGIGTAIGGLLGGFGSRFFGKPSISRVARYSKTNTSAPAKTPRTLMRGNKGQGTDYRIGDQVVLDKQIRMNDGTFGTRHVPASPEYQAYLEGAGGNPAYSIEILGMKNGGSFNKKNYFGEWF
jgi:peptidoglycan hydrolase-like protein with peptidoglycan-binding domain